jgi:hypothetical protein
MLSSVLPSIANEVLKSVVAQYNAIELIGKREAVCPRPGCSTIVRLLAPLARMEMVACEGHFSSWISSTPRMPAAFLLGAVWPHPQLSQPCE